MKTRIISAFPGTGKTTYSLEHPDTAIDADTTAYDWVNGVMHGEHNPDFPNNYMEYVKENIGKVEFIFVPTHHVIRESLQSDGIHFYLVYPHGKERRRYIKRYRERGNSDKFVNDTIRVWSRELKECRNDRLGCTNIQMTEPFLSDVLVRIVNDDL